MRKTCLLIVAISFIFGSCASISYPSKGNGIEVALTPKNYDIVGEVVYEGTTKSIMGLLTWGGATHYDLLQKAKKDYDADEIINVSIDIKNTFIYVFYFTQTYILRGVAIKYK